MSAWSVRIRFTEPTYDMAKHRRARVRVWTWTGMAFSAADARAQARKAFETLFALSSVGWVREIVSVAAWQRSPSLLVNEAPHA